MYDVNGYFCWRSNRQALTIIPLIILFSENIPTLAIHSPIPLKELNILDQKHRSIRSSDMWAVVMAKFSLSVDKGYEISCQNK